MPRSRIRIDGGSSRYGQENIVGIPMREVNPGVVMVAARVVNTPDVDSMNGSLIP